MASQDWVDKDFYATLGVSKDASQDEIKKAYRKAARKYHPDQNPGDEAAEKKFKELSEANSVLSDPEQREQYDALRAMGSGARFTGGYPGSSGGGTGGFEDLFGGLFGGGGGRASYSTSGGPDLGDLFGGMGGMGGFGGGGFNAPPQKGSDLTANATLSFKESITGTTIRLRGGDGKTTEMRVPAGIRDGQKVRSRGKGQQGPGGAGDLIVTIKVREDSTFTRDGNNLRVDVPITVAEAVAGATIEVPTIDDFVKVKVPAGSSSGRVLRLKGRGVKTKKATGDLLIDLQIVLPDELTPEAEDAAKAFAAATEDFDPRAELMQKATA